MRLTKPTVAVLALPAGKVDHIEFDDELPGFGVRLRGAGKRWVVQYRIGAQQRRESLGDVRKVTLDDARKIARQRFAQVELGVDPGAERVQSLTLGVVIDFTGRLPVYLVVGGAAFFASGLGMITLGMLNKGD